MEYSELYQKYLNFRDGIFVEAGANNGIDQSNTISLEYNQGWSGLLVEPNPFVYKECVANRPRSTCENYALVSSTYASDTINGDFSHRNGNDQSLMGTVEDPGDYCDEHLLEAKASRKNDYGYISVPATTLNSLLKKHNITKIDFLSLDVEGYEISVLNGLDLNLYRPTYCLIETAFNFANGRRLMAVSDHMIRNSYEVLENVSHGDTLYRSLTNFI